jgi:N-acetylglucosaminyldiphosphoundecaprenol N-acetyl-beta-D-mannosaminyltransferase
MMHSTDRDQKAAGGLAELPYAIILGIRVQAISLQQTIDQLEHWLSTRSKRYALFPGAAVLAEAHHCTPLRSALLGADLVGPDGMSLVRLCRWSGLKETTRVYGPDVMLELCCRSQHAGYKHFFYGATPETLKRLEEALGSRFPNLRVAGSFAPPFRELRPEEEDAIAVMLNEADPDIIWVGLSSPKQDIWIARMRPKLKASLILGVGAAFDFHAGVVRQAPSWIRNAGFEFLFRIAMEPRRLWRRYIVSNAYFVYLCVRSRLILYREKVL